MLDTLKQQVSILESTCHTAMREREDRLARSQLIEALLAFYVDAPEETPAVIKGLCNVARARADILLAKCRENDEAGVQLNLDRLCAALGDLKKSIALASAPSTCPRRSDGVG